MTRLWCAMLALAGCGRISFEPIGEPLDEGWAWQLPLTINNAGREELVRFPVLVKLDATRLDYSLLQPNARDLRFVDIDDVQLPYEIDTWDPSGTSYVWVRVPRIAAGSSIDRIYAAFGNSAASDAQDAADVWADYAGVWHLGEESGADASARDSTAHDNTGALHGGMSAQNRVAGQIGSALVFEGVDDYVEVPNHSSLDVTTLTVEGWLNPAVVGVSASLISKDGIGSDTSGAYNVRMSSASLLQYHTNNLTSSNETKTGACCAAVGRWDYFAFTIDAAATASSYRNGVLGETQTLANPLVLDTTLLFARRGRADAFYAGVLDELRLASGVRSADWIAAQYASMTDALITYGATEPR